MRETSEVERALAAQEVCEASHEPAAEHEVYSRPVKEEAMNHAEWKTRRHRALLDEAVEENPEYDRLYEEAELAHDLGRLVYDRRTALGLSQAALAERCGMKQPQISRIEGGGTMPTIPLLRRLARALDADLTIELTPHHAAA